MTMKETLLDCDWCEQHFAIADLWNVSYSDGFANVLCDDCVEVTQKENAHRLEEVWK